MPCPAFRWPGGPIAKFNEFRYELFLHPAYSPDLASCDYFLFPNLKKWFGGKRFTTREQLIVETEAYFEGLDKSYYSDDLKKRWRIVGSSVSSWKETILRNKNKSIKKNVFYCIFKNYIFKNLLTCSHIYCNFASACFLCHCPIWVLSAGKGIVLFVYSNKPFVISAVSNMSFHNAVIGIELYELELDVRHHDGFQFVILHEQISATKSSSDLQTYAFP